MLPSQYYNHCHTADLHVSLVSCKQPIFLCNCQTCWSRRYPCREACGLKVLARVMKATPTQQTSSTLLTPWCCYLLTTKGTYFSKWHTVVWGVSVAIFRTHLDLKPGTGHKDGLCALIRHLGVTWIKSECVALWSELCKDYFIVPFNCAIQRTHRKQYDTC